MLTKVVRPIEEQAVSLPLRNGGIGQHTSSAGTADHQTKLNSLLDILLATDLNLPGTSAGVQLALTFLPRWIGGQVPTALSADDIVRIV